MTDMKATIEPSRAPIILRRPFLATARVVTDWGKGEEELKVGEQIVRVNINKLMKHPSHASEDIGAIDLDDEDDIASCVEEVMTLQDELTTERTLESLPTAEPSLDLKPLPSSLKYVFLDKENARPVIISS